MLAKMARRLGFKFGEGMGTAENRKGDELETRD
jgi:hypothetical protein